MANLLASDRTNKSIWIAMNASGLQLYDFVSAMIIKTFAKKAVGPRRGHNDETFPDVPHSKVSSGYDEEL